MQRTAADLTAAHAAPQEPPAAPRRPLTRLAPVAAILLAPLAGVLLMRAPLVNALFYRDPWFYSGYGWEMAHHVEIFGWFYYSVRFPVNLPIAWSSDVFGAVPGYVVLRYAILTLTGGALYACLRRFASVWVAATGVLLLCLSPFYLRAVLWDYTSFVALPCTVAGIAVWFLGRGTLRRELTALASGSLLAAAVFANPLSGLVLPALYAPEAVTALRVRAAGAYVGRLAASALGAVLVFAAGYLGYRSYLGSFSPRELVQPTIDFIRSNEQLAGPFQIPAREWLAREPRVYAPVLACLALAVIGGRRLLGVDPAARLAQVALAYTAVFWLYRKFMTSSVIETWWAYSMTAATIAFALPLVLHELGRRGAGTRAVVGGALAGAAVADLAVRSLDGSVVRLVDSARDSEALLALLLAVPLAAIAALRLARRPAVLVAATAVATAGVMFFSLAPAEYIGVRHTGEFSPFSTGEIDGYAAAHSMTELLGDEDQPPSRVLLWTTLEGMADVGWTNLPHQQGGIQNPEAPVPLPQLPPPLLDAVLYPTTSAVLVITESASDADAALGALREAGVPATSRDRGTWGDGQLQYHLIDVRAES